jgi:hypothetical protein
MRARCKYPSTINFHRYGGRGISVCAEWEEDFPTFRDWSLSNGYADNLTLDREDNDGDYTPGNCRWITMKQQHRNRSNNVRYPFRGQDMTVPEIAEIIGIPAPALHLRLTRYGMSVEDATTRQLRYRTNTPVQLRSI